MWGIIWDVLLTTWPGQCHLQMLPAGFRHAARGSLWGWTLSSVGSSLGFTVPSCFCLHVKFSQTAVQKQLGNSGGKGCRRTGSFKVVSYPNCTDTSEPQTYCWAPVGIWASSPQAGKWPRSRPAPLTERFRFLSGSLWCLHTGGRWPRTGCTDSRRRGRTASAVERKPRWSDTWMLQCGSGERRSTFNGLGRSGWVKRR